MKRNEIGLTRIKCLDAPPFLHRVSKVEGVTGVQIVPKSVAHCVGEPFQKQSVLLVRGDSVRAEIELDFFDRSPEDLWQPGITRFRHHRQAVIGSDVHPGVAGETQRHGVLEFAFGHLLFIDEKPASPPCRGRAGFVGRKFLTDFEVTFGQAFTRGQSIEFQAEETVGVVQSTALYVERKAPEKTGLSHDDAFQSLP